MKYIVELKEPIRNCPKFLDVAWEVSGRDHIPYLYPRPSPNERAKRRADLRGTCEEVKLDVYKVVESDLPYEDIKSKLLRYDFVRKVYPEPLPPKPLGTNDPYWGDLWHLQDTEEGSANFEDAWDDATGDGIVVALLDSSGVRYTHEDLGGTGDKDADWEAIQDGNHPKIVLYTRNNWPINPYGEGHGTYMAGVIGAIGNNSLGVCGAAYNAKIMACSYPVFYLSIIDVVDQGADVICWPYTIDSWDIYEAPIDYAISNGVPVVMPHHSNTDTEYWDGYYKVIFVSAHDKEGNHWYSWGNVDVSAPGREVMTTHPDSDSSYGFFYGECPATACVASLCALILEKNPTWSPVDVRQAIRQGAKKSVNMGGKIWTKYYGWGMIDAKATLSLNLEDLEIPPPEKFSVTQSRNKVYIQWKNLKRPDHWSGVKIVRKEGSTPNGVTDGTLVYKGEGEGVVDTLPKSGRWYYAIFSYD